ncbi:MAG: hypothetical protein M1832_003251 [Thelocarpon impressellum]|nr:MAG: hypothetical protein M1832_003251 [Thelocarpon impressellum]
MSYPAPLVVPAVKKHTATVIMAHGLGDSGAGWISLAQNFRRLQKFEHVSFIFPNAPSIPITANGGMRMPGWYDISSFTDLLQKSADEAGILRSRDYIQHLIATEQSTKSIPPSRIVLGGFSQGGALALLAGVTSPAPLAGVFALSAYLLLADKIPSLVPATSPPKEEVKIFMGHGADDPLVRCDWGRRTAEQLRAWGWSGVEFKTYPDLVHSVDPAEMDDVEAFLRGRLGAE